MSYSKQNFVDGQVLEAAHLNRIEDAIAELASRDDYLGVAIKLAIKGYTHLNYIETTGTQYIDTGFVPNQDTRVVCEFMLTEIVNLGGIYGARRTVAGDDFSLRTSYANAVGNRWQPCYNNEYGTFTDVPVDKEWHTADQNKNKFFLDGVLRSTCTYAEFSAPRPITIGAVKNNSSINYSNCRFRRFCVYDNGTLVRDLVSCKNASGDIGMYDLLNDVFYKNAGTGEFVAGPSTLKG